MTCFDFVSSPTVLSFYLALKIENRNEQKYGLGKSEFKKVKSFRLRIDHTLMTTKKNWVFLNGFVENNWALKGLKRTTEKKNYRYDCAF